MNVSIYTDSFEYEQGFFLSSDILGSILQGFPKVSEEKSGEIEKRGDLSTSFRF